MIKITLMDSGKANVLSGSLSEIEFFVAAVYLTYNEYVEIMEDLTDFPVKEDSFKSYITLCKKIAKEMTKEMDTFYDNDWFDFDYLSEVGCGRSKRLRIEVLPA